MVEQNLYYENNLTGTSPPLSLWAAGRKMTLYRETVTTI
jgi:hypothetical protein